MLQIAKRFQTQRRKINRKAFRRRPGTLDVILPAGTNSTRADVTGTEKDVLEEEEAMHGCKVVFERKMNADENYQKYLDFGSQYELHLPTQLSCEKRLKATELLETHL